MLTRRLFLACAALLAICSGTPHTALAQADAGATQFIKTLGDETVANFAKKGLSKDEATARFRVLLNRGFDVPYIGRWVLGRYWAQATPTQQAEYQTLFETLIVRTYANRFREYSGETFKVLGARAEGDKDFMVTTQILRPQGPPISVDWRVRQRDGQYKIIDVVVERLSMGVTQREDFGAIIQSSGGQIEGLIKALRERVATAG